MTAFTSRLLAGAAALVPLAAPAVVHAEAFRFHYDHVLGTSLDVVAMAPDEASALMAVSAAHREIARLNAVLSAWRDDSELSELNRSGAVKASADLNAVIKACEAWRAETDGAFDCRMGGPLAVLRSGDTAHLQKAVDASRADIAFAHNGVVTLAQGSALTVDGLAKGYVIDAALKAARKASPGLAGLMIDIGGDLSCWGQAPTLAGWTVGVAEGHDADNTAPATRLRLKGGAVAASGRGMRDLTVDGCAAAHVLSPKTGRPASMVSHAVVTAPNARDADALSTAFMAMKPLKAIALADRLAGVEARIISDDGKQHVSKGWDALLVPASYSAPILAAAPAAAARGIGLDIGYTVPKIDAEPYHAPYVVMWVTDENRQMVRTLVMLGAKPKWAPENFVWWRRYGRQAPGVLETVARPTRLPGKYTAHWDGKDETGKPVGPGKYILHIESSREKGGHTYQTVDLDLSAAGAKALPAKDEMGAVELKFGPGA